MNTSNDKFSNHEFDVKVWLKKAKEDELFARSILKHRDAPPSGVCFNSQQMAEKYLKTFLIYKKKWYPKIHSLDKLWELCFEINKSFEEVKEDAIFLTEFYVATRYPGDYPEFSWKDAKKSFSSAGRIKNFVLEKLSPASCASWFP